MRSLEIFRDAGVKIGFGSDLLGQLQNDHCNEFAIRAQVMSPQRDHPLGDARECGDRAAGGQARRARARARMPTCWWWTAIRIKDLGVFRNDGRNIRAIMTGGRFFLNRLHEAA